MEKDLISIVVPIYNVEEYLERCIISMINQTYKNIEIILVDDGSPDNSIDICNKYKKLDKRIKIIRKENGGLSDARNKGIESAKGKFITFVDSDDTIELDYIEYLYNLIKKYDADLSICDYSATYSNGTVLNRNSNKEYCTNKHDCFEHMLYQEDYTVSAWAKLYKTEMWNDVKYPKGKIFEDAYTTYKIVDKCDKIAVGLESKYNYMIRGNSILTGSFSRKKLLLVDAYEEMGNFVLKEYPDLAPAVNRANIYSRISTLRQMIYIKDRLRKEEKDFVDYIKKHYKEIKNNPKVSKRDKVGALLIKINLNLFKLSWRIYCKKTGRQV